tara:strand:- start:1856 stop:2602 length:747 start_codon:yes stop_codon:yes gene_type:complete
LAYEPKDGEEEEFADLRTEMWELGYNLTKTFDSEDQNDVQLSVFESETDLIIAFRGTDSLQDLLVDLKSAVLIDFKNGVGQIGKGVHGCVDAVQDCVDRLVYFTKKRVTFTGHSIGGVLACAVASTQTPAPLTITFGCPLIGDKEFTRAFNNAVVHHRWVNGNDIITRVPWRLGRFKHTRTLHYITMGHRIAKAWIAPSWLKMQLNRWGWFKISPSRWAKTALTNHPVRSYHLGLKTVMLQRAFDQYK